jgi:hypothetical protein
MDTPVEQLLQSALLRWARTDPDGILLSKLKTIGNHLSDFVNLSKRQWSELKIPLMLQVHILEAIEQAKSRGGPMSTGSLDSVEVKERPFEDSYNEIISQITALGFTQREAMDAVDATESKEVDVLVDFILSSPQSRPKPSHHPEDWKQLLSSISSTSTPASSRGLVSPAEEARLASELSHWQDLASEERAHHTALMQKSTPQEQDHATKCVSAFDRALFLSDPNPDSSLVHLSNLYRRQLHVPEHNSLSISRCDSEDGDLDASLECSMCMSRRKTQIHLNCMHLCFCEACFTDWHAQSEVRLCPTCRTPVLGSRTLGQ